jgi:hypothetical protein
MSTLALETISAPVEGIIGEESIADLEVEQTFQAIVEQLEAMPSYAIEQLATEPTMKESGRSDQGYRFN